jgi:hypothetical protein
LKELLRFTEPTHPDYAELQKALEGIKGLHYMDKYRAESRPVTLVGVCFDGTHSRRRVGHVQVEALADAQN